MSLENSEMLGQFVQIAVWILGAVLLIIKIVQSFRRSPAIEAEFATKLDMKTCKDTCTAQVCSINVTAEKREEASQKSRARLHEHLENLRADMDGKMRALGEQSSAQSAKSELFNQRQVEMDRKIDALLQR